ncbi:MAG TPA: LptA/OstA family protein, partial [Rhodospirillales bacterium]|nr:LptA/OstA family protein [Rhodospirillales bacterium]
RAVRGDLQVQARELRALYRDGPDGKAEIYRVIAEGAVRIATPNQTAFGQHAVFDVPRDHLMLTGGERVRLTSGADEVSAERSLEYWPGSDRLVARGNAVAIQPNREIHGETITMYFAEGPDGTKQLDTAEAVENVKVVTAEETIFGDRSNYDAKTGMANVEGSVKILRGRDQLDGCRGEIDFNSGVSRLFACERSQTSDGRVRGRIQLNGGKAD